jgi:hypothetical protein
MAGPSPSTPSYEQDRRHARDVLLFQLIINYLVEGKAPVGDRMVELNAHYRSFCQREPIGGMFLESAMEELMDQVRNGKAV